MVKILLKNKAWKSKAPEADFLVFRLILDPPWEPQKQSEKPKKQVQKTKKKKASSERQFGDLLCLVVRSTGGTFGRLRQVTKAYLVG